MIRRFNFVPHSTIFEDTLVVSYMQNTQLENIHINHAWEQINENSLFTSRKLSRVN